MIQEHIEILKWFIAIPSALIATIAMPWVIKKNYLECKKLHLEIIRLQKEIGGEEEKTIVPGPIFSWFARYWAIPCYGLLAILIPISFVIKSGWLVGIAFTLSLVFFITGSTINEHYLDIKKDIEKTHN